MKATHLHCCHSLDPPPPNMFTMLVLLQLVFALVSPGRVVPNLVAGAIAEAGAQQAGDMMQVRWAWVARRGILSTALPLSARKSCPGHIFFWTPNQLGHTSH
jgi:hypothetical protein